MFSGRCFIAAMLVAVFFFGSAQAKPNLSDWSSVQGLKLGSKLMVSTRKGERFEGELKHVDADSLLLLVRVSRSARQAIELRRDDVSEVRKPKSRVLTTALGMGIGLGVGLGIGAIYDSQHTGTDDPGLGKLVYGALGAGSGLAVGGFLRLKGKKIYVAP